MIFAGGEFLINATNVVEGSEGNDKVVPVLS
jgi:hypothetical protein